MFDEPLKKVWKNGKVVHDMKVIMFGKMHVVLGVI